MEINETSKLINLDEIIEALQDLGIAISRAKSFVDEGKEVYCSQKLQGALVKCGNIMKYCDSFRVVEETLQNSGDSNGIMANQSQ